MGKTLFKGKAPFFLHLLKFTQDILHYLGFYTLKDLTGLPLHDWEICSSDNLRHKCEKLEEGGIFRNLGIRNFLEGDLFSWYIQAWNDEIYKAVKQIITHLNDYDPETMEIAPDETRDILKKLYQYLVPKQIRHDLGEYYTPDWLAERCLNQLAYNGDPKYRILDPGCGSGTFLILAIKRAKEFAANRQIESRETLKKILLNIQGFDLNPLAVISARTNYMLAIADLLKYRIGEITLPIYLCDSINPPQARIADEMTLFEKKLPYEVKTTVGNFLFSHGIITKQRVQELANIMEDCVKSDTSKEAFLKKVEMELNLDKEEYDESELYLEDAYEQLVKLDKQGINGVWARIIKNAFAPLFVGKFDMVVGNPPWVNWESLPEGYRKETEKLWFKYNLLPKDKKLQRQKSVKSKTDISILMTYVSLDKYLKQNSKLAFVITQTIVKTERGGRGFRRFELPNKIPLKVIHFDDFTSFQPFEGATNRTAAIVIHRDQAMKYPLPYTFWLKKSKNISSDYSLKDIMGKTKRYNWFAEPIDNSDNTSPWIAGRKNALSAILKIKGYSEYYNLCREGSNTRGANGVFWCEKLPDKVNEENCMIANLPQLGRINVPELSMEIEQEILFPLLRGKDVKRWNALCKYWIINVNDPQNPSEPIPLDVLQANFPHGYKYLLKCENILRNRPKFRNFDPSSGEFYGLYNVGKYSYNRYKVVWREQSSFIISAVATEKDNKPIVPDHKLMMLPCNTPEEAYFICACLNSSIMTYAVKSFAVETSISTNLFRYIKVPLFDELNPVHNEISKLSFQCYEKSSLDIDIFDLEEHIDELVAEMWGLSKGDLNEIKKCLEELR